MEIRKGVHFHALSADAWNTKLGLQLGRTRNYCFNNELINTDETSAYSTRNVCWELSLTLRFHKSSTHVCPL